MCMVSAVMPQAQQSFASTWPHYDSATVAQIARDMKDVLARLDRLDKQLGLRDCKEEEASKAAFLAKLDELSQAAKAL
jgi:hypothetical protein